MEVVHPRCCGIDVHQASLAICVSIKEDQQDGEVQIALWNNHSGPFAASRLAA